MTNGAVGGDKGCEAADANFRFAVDTAAALEDGERIKKRKPIDNTQARMIVMGFVRRIALGRAMMEVVEGAPTDG